MNKQLIQFSFKGVTEKQYDQIWNELRRAGHSNPAGLLYHVASFQNNNCLVFDVWESPEAFEKFGQVLMPIMYKVGIDEPTPIMTPVLRDISFAEENISH